MTKQNLLFLDTETTGLTSADRLCQVAYNFNGMEAEALFKPPLPISVDAMVVTHITNQMVLDKPLFADAPMKADLSRILGEGNILVAHNARFDVEMLKREGVITPQYIDTFKVAYALDTNDEIPRYALQYLRYFLDLEVPDAAAHSAQGDVKVLMAVFECLYARMLETLGDETTVIKEMLAISAGPLLFRNFNFGKYTGQAVKDVASNDPSYVTWLFNQKVMNRESGEDDDENWIYTLDFYMKK
jgi:DNA polymerase III alpha subunit (gram-positive type)